jgi:hypothetical protein
MLHVQIGIAQFFEQHLRDCIDIGFLRMLADYRDRLSWGNVVSRGPIILRIGCIEVFPNDLFSSRQSVSSAHELGHSLFGYLSSLSLAERQGYCGDDKNYTYFNTSSRHICVIPTF